VNLLCAKKLRFESFCAGFAQPFICFCFLQRLMLLDHRGLPLKDVPMDLCKWKRGHLGRAKNRSQIGYSNRRENYTFSVAPILSHIKTDRSKVNDMLNSSMSRSMSAPLDRVSATPNPREPQKSLVGPTLPPPPALLEELTAKGHSRSFTPESFFFNSHSVGSGGQLTAKKENWKRRDPPPKVPTGRELTSALLNVPEFQKSSLHHGVAGIVVPPETTDTSTSALSRAVSCEPWRTRNLCYDQATFQRTSYSSERQSLSELRAEQRPSKEKIYAQQHHFFISTPGTETADSSIPDVEPLRPKLRHERTPHRSTSHLTQPPPDAGMAADESSRFTAADRALGSALLGQRERVRRQALLEIRAKRYGDAQARCVDAATRADLFVNSHQERRIAEQHAASRAAWAREQVARNEWIKEMEEIHKTQGW
jgi:hypothetical protein